MDADRIHYISFANQEVAVRSEEPAVIQPFLLSFRGLLKKQPTDLLATLSVVKEHEGYRVDGANMFEGDSETAKGVLQCLKFEVIHRFVEVHPELLWLHAGAAALEERAVLLCGSWGSGKSTMVGHLCRKGWTYLSDDIVPVDRERDSLVPFPLTPMMRAHEEDAEGVRLSRAEVSNLSKHIVDLDDEAVAKKNIPIASIVFPQFNPTLQQSKLMRISPATATLELLRNCLDLKIHKEKALHYLGKLVENLPVFLLNYSNGEEASNLIVEAHLRNYSK